MYESLKENCADFHLYIFAFDDKSLEVLTKLKLEKATVVSLKEFEDPGLLKVKSTRTLAEYCWTCTSSVILYSINTFKLHHCTYLDSDLFFYSDPQILIDEAKGKSVIITEHRYSPQYNYAVERGKYCVQFVYFKNDERGMKVLNWWRNACIEWCYARMEDGKFGDQKYLDNWLNKFEGVHELKHLGGGLAPWNIQQYDLYKKNEKVFLKEKHSEKEYSAVFFHFHYLKFFKNNIVLLTAHYDLDKKIKELFYYPYIKKLQKIKSSVQKIDNSFDPNGTLQEDGEHPFNMQTALSHYLKDLKKRSLSNIILFKSIRERKKHHHFYYLNDIIKN
jgi:hypothetical protein